MSEASETQAVYEARLLEEEVALLPILPPNPPDMTVILVARTADILVGFASMISPPTPAVVKKYSTSLDPYNTQALDTDTKDSKYQWTVVTKRIKRWKPLHTSVKNANKLMDLFNNHKVQFGVNPICTAPMSGTGNTYPTSHTIAGV